MRILALSILLFTSNLIKSSKDQDDPFENLINKIRDIPQRVHDLYLESQLSNGKISSMELVEELLNRTMNLTIYDEYSRMIIPNGINEFNELFRLFRIAKKYENNNETILIRKGLEEFLNLKDHLNELEELKKSINENLEYLEYVEEQVISVPSNLVNFRSLLQKLRNDFEELRKIFERGTHNQKEEKIVQIQSLAAEMNEVFLSIESKLNTVDPKSAIALNDKLGNVNITVDGIKKLENLTSSLYDVQLVLETIDELRDSHLIKNVTGWFKKLNAEIESMNRLKISKEVIQKYQNIGIAQKFIEKVSNFTRDQNKFQWFASKLKNRWIPLNDHLNQIDIPSDNLASNWITVKSCLEDYDFSIDFSEEMENMDWVLGMIENMESIPRRLLLEHWEHVNKEISTREFVSSGHVSEPYGLKLLDITLTSNPEEIYELSLKKYESYLKDLNVSINKKIPIIEGLMKCSIDLEITDFESSMNLPKEIWNFNPKLTNYALEAIIYFKRIQKMIVGLNESKFENNPSIESFPLNNEEVNGISDGFEVLKSLKNVNEIWNKMRRLNGFEKSEVENTWNSVRNGIEKVKNELSEMRSQSKFTDIQELISNIELSNDVTEVDSLIDFIQRKYKGIIRSQYLNILEDVKYLIINFGDFPKKIQKMNEGIEKYEQWIGDDCSLENSDNCTTTPSLPTSEEPNNDEL